MNVWCIFGADYWWNVAQESLAASERKRFVATRREEQALAACFLWAQTYVMPSPTWLLLWLPVDRDTSTKLDLIRSMRDHLQKARRVNQEPLYQTNGNTGMAMPKVARATSAGSGIDNHLHPAISISPHRNALAYKLGLKPRPLALRSYHKKLKQQRIWTEKGQGFSSSLVRLVLSRK